MLIGVALQTAAQNLGFFIGARFLIGFGLTFACEHFVRLLSIRYADGPNSQLGAYAGHGNFVPAVPPAAHLSLQLPLVLRQHHRVVDDVRHPVYWQHVVMASPVDHAGRSRSVPVPPHPTRARESTLAHLQGPRRRGSTDPRVLSR